MISKKTTRKTTTRKRKINPNIKFTPFIIEECIQFFLAQKRKTFKGSEADFLKEIEPELKKLSIEISQDVINVAAKVYTRQADNSRLYNTKVVRQISTNHRGSLQLFDFLIQVNASTALECYRRYYKIFKSSDDRVKLLALIEIHSRACQIAAEINLLVKNGYADGAQARWRSLHELCVTFLFLYDNDVTVVKMYNDYETIESYDKIKKYAVAHPKLNWKPIPQQEIDALEIERQALMTTYGKAFAGKYGWASTVLSPDQRHFKGMEQAVAKDSLRGIYSWSSDNVHAGVLGNRNRMGLPSGKKHYLLNGPSQYGLFDPIQFTSFSLVEMTDALIGLEESILNDLRSTMLWKFHDGMVEVLTRESKELKRRKKRVVRVKKKSRS